MARKAAALKPDADLRALDAQTSALCKRLLAAPANRDLATAVDTSDDELTLDCDDRLRAGAGVVLVPGIFYRDYPHTGADGAVLREIAGRLGLPFRTIPVDGTAGLDGGADIILAWLSDASCPERVVLVSLSKGSAEVRHALTRPGSEHAFSKVTGWISISGLPFGTPSFENFLRHSLRSVFVRTLCRCKGWRFDNIREVLSHRPDAPFVLPPHVQFVQIAAFPQHRDLLDRRSRRMHRQLAPLGPNDGFAVLSELAQLPGLFYPVRNADHYLRNLVDMPERIGRLLHLMLHRAAQ